MFPLGLEVIALTLSDTEASITFVGGAKLEVKKLKMSWSVVLRESGTMDRVSHAKKREGAAEEAARMFEQWRRSEGDP